MSRRIDIELTSALGDGTWTWRAAGARQPKGVLDGSILPTDASVGDELKVEVDQEIDGITVLSVVHGREKQARDDVIELLPSEREFKPVVETRAKRGKGDRRPRREGGRDSDGGDRGKRRGGGDRQGGRGERGRDERGRDERGRDGSGDGRRGGEGRRGDGRRRGPSFTPPPEVPQRPKPKRLKPGKANRSAVLAGLPEEQRPIAELALQGMGAVRQRLREANDQAVAEGKPVMPEAGVLKMAEEMLPKLRVAEWRDRAEAAQRQVEHLDLRDLRSVVAAAGDPMVARDESTRALADELKVALATKQEQELVLWFGDVDAALAVGRVIRALRLSSQPPKAGVPFPVDIAQRLADSTNASLSPMDSPERWAATLEAAAFAPIRSLIAPVKKPDVVNDELLATVKRLAPALPQVAALFEIEVDPGTPMPKPLRPTYGQKRHDGKKGKEGKDDSRKSGGRADKGGRSGQQSKRDRGRSGEAAAAAAPAAADGDAPASPAPSRDQASDGAPAADARDGTAEPSVPAPRPDANAPTAAESTRPAPAAERQADVEPDPAAEPEPATEPDPADESEAVTAEPEPAAVASAEPEPAAEQQADVEPDPAAEPRAVADAPAGPAPEPDTSAEPEPAPARTTEPAAVASAEPEPAAEQQADVEPDPAAEPRAVADAPAGPAPEPEPAPAGTAEPEPADDPQADAEPEA